VDDRQFDDMTRTVGMQSDRRGMLKAAVGGALGLVGLSALTARALADEVVAEARHCDTDKDCKNKDVCDKKNNKCVECNKSKDCKHHQKCKNHQCKHK